MQTQENPKELGRDGTDELFLLGPGPGLRALIVMQFSASAAMAATPEEDAIRATQQAWFAKAY